MRLNDKIPTIEPTGEAGIFGFLEVFGQDFLREAFLVGNEEASSVREPLDNFAVDILVEDLHQLRDKSARHHGQHSIIKVL